MNERILEHAFQAEFINKRVRDDSYFIDDQELMAKLEKFAELIVADMHRKVIASILITDVVMEEKGLAPTSEDYICAINKDFGVEE